MEKKDNLKKKNLNKRKKDSYGNKNDCIKEILAVQPQITESNDKISQLSQFTKEQTITTTQTSYSRKSPLDIHPATEASQMIKEIELTNFKFYPVMIKVHCNTKIRWIIKENSATYESGVYNALERFFIIAINALDIESDPLYTGNTFEHIFTNAGSFEIVCANYPGIRGVIEVTRNVDNAFTTVQMNYKDRCLFVSKSESKEGTKSNKSQLSSKDFFRPDLIEDFRFENRKKMFDIKPEILDEMTNYISKNKKITQEFSKKFEDEVKNKKLMTYYTKHSDTEGSAEEDESHNCFHDNIIAQFLRKETEKVDTFSFSPQKLDEPTDFPFAERKEKIPKEGLPNPTIISSVYGYNQIDSNVNRTSEIEEQLAELDRPKVFDSFYELLKSTTHDKENFNAISTVKLDEVMKSENETAKSFLRTRKMSRLHSRFKVINLQVLNSRPYLRQ